LTSDSTDPKKAFTKKGVFVMAGIFLVSLASLMLEILITRVYSVIIWYGYAFIVISVAMLGLSFGGVFSHFFVKNPKTLLRSITLATLTFAASIPIAIYAVLQFPLNTYVLYAYYAFSVVPFFFCGVCISAIFQNQKKAAYGLYFADMVGASVGCFLVEPLLGPFGAVEVIVLLSVIVSSAGVLFALASQRRKLVALSLVFLSLSTVLFVGNHETNAIDIVPNVVKSLFRVLESDSGFRNVASDWNSISRVDVVQGYQGQVMANIFIDADAGTAVYNWSGSVNSLDFMRSNIFYTPYNVIKNPRNTLIIGSGGGGDILAALEGGSASITAVEVNPLVIQAVKNLTNVYSWDDGKPPFDDIHEVVADGRSFISRTNDKFDVIVLTLVDSWAALASGGYALAENYLYTKEAFQHYYDHLTEGGTLSMTRWITEVPKLVATATEMLESEGVPPSEVGRYIAITTWTSSGQEAVLFMLKKTAFSPEEAQILENSTFAMGADHGLLYVPYVYEQGQYAGVLNGTVSLEQFYSQTQTQAKPATDDSPFFFSFEKGVPASMQPLIIFAVLATLGVAAVPLLRKRSAQKTKAALPFIAYFAALGLGYMLVEITLVQKFILFLGNPTLTLSVILFTLLAATGLGSLAGNFVKIDLKKKTLLACACVITLIAAYIFLINPVLNLMLPQEQLTRVLVTIFLLFPLGFAMGLPFPSGINFLSHDESKVSVQWMWAINGIMSVLGSVLATVIGITMGLSFGLVIALACYAVALVSSAGWKLRAAT
jgi:spermidine synthase